MQSQHIKKHVYYNAKHSLYIKKSSSIAPERVFLPKGNEF